jgi:hypothetical protein
MFMKLVFGHTAKIKNSCIAVEAQIIAMKARGTDCMTD